MQNADDKNSMLFLPIIHNMAHISVVGMRSLGRGMDKSTALVGLVCQHLQGCP